jgi:tetratricopeptide (TPR) repeat protein
MGYMGFGMQRWIYNQKPRKAFSNTSKSGKIDIGQDKSLPSVHAGSAKAARKKVDNYFAKAHRAKRIALLAGILVLALLMAIGYMIYQDQSPMKKATAESLSIAADYAQKDGDLRHAFHLYIKSGQLHYDNAEYEKAIATYNKAIELYPKGRLALVGLARSYDKLCTTAGKECLKAEALSYMR